MTRTPPSSSGSTSRPETPSRRETPTRKDPPRDTAEKIAPGESPRPPPGDKGPDVRDPAGREPSDQIAPPGPGVGRPPPAPTDPNRPSTPPGDSPQKEKMPKVPRDGGD